jgi:hypothetical protein
LQLELQNPGNFLKCPTFSRNPSEIPYSLLKMGGNKQEIHQQGFLENLGILGKIRVSCNPTCMPDVPEIE